MNTERLLKLADYMETLPDGRVDMSLWRDLPDELTDRIKDGEEISLSGQECGTVACVLGHACTIPEFIKDGLEMRIRRSEGMIDIEITYSVYSYWSAASVFFDIPFDHATYLFGSYPKAITFYGMDKLSPKGIAAGIRRYVSHGGDLVKATANKDLMRYQQVDAED